LTLGQSRNIVLSATAKQSTATDKKETEL